jgi:hypothetical protein
METAGGRAVLRDRLGKGSRVSTYSDDRLSISIIRLLDDEEV